MKVFTEKEIRVMVRTIMLWEKGRGVSEADAIFKRGYRTALRNLQDLVNAAARDRDRPSSK